MDRGAWKAANPALSSFRSFVELEQSAEKAARMPSFENSFRNLYLNQRVNMVSAFVSPAVRSEEHTSELQSLMRTSYAVFCLKKKKPHHDALAVPPNYSQYIIKYYTASTIR